MYYLKIDDYCSMIKIVQLQKKVIKMAVFSISDPEVDCDLPILQLSKKLETVFSISDPEGD